MATLTSYSVVPELQHFYNNFVIASKLNKSKIPIPVDIAPLYMGRNSFIEMLFNDNYSQTNYEYRYSQQMDPLSIPRSVFNRIMVYPGSSQYLYLDSTGTNIFNLQAIDFTLLDALLAYRMDSTSLVIIDSTSSISLVSDSTTGISILTCSFSTLTTELSKLIYLYLNLEIYDRYDDYNNLLLVSTCGVLESCYESYLIEKYFEFMSNREPNLIYTC